MNETNLTRSRPEHFSNSLLYFELVVVGITMSAICIVTIIGNALVLISFAVDKKLRTLSNYFLLSLAVSDVLIACVSMPIFTLFTVEGEWILGPVVCDMWLAQDYICSSASGFNLLMISFDRYFSVTRPLRYRAQRTGKRVALMITFVWVVSFLMWPPWIYLWPVIDGRRTVPDYDCYVQFLETNAYITIITCVSAFYIPLFIMCVLYFRIWLVTEKRKKQVSKPDIENTSLHSVHPYKTVSKKGFLETAVGCCSSTINKNSKRSESPKLPEEVELCSVTALSSQKQLAQESSFTNTNEHVNTPNISVNNETISTLETCDNTSDKHNPKEALQLRLSSNAPVKSDHKAARTLTAILLAFIITVTPYNVVAIVKNLDTKLVSEPLWNFFYFLFYINSTLNPLCYALANANFRKTYWKILTCSWRSNSRNISFDDHSNKSSQNKNNGSST